MGKYIIFAATKRDCGCRFWHKGDWQATSYVLYSDGSCYRTQECVEEPPRSVKIWMDPKDFDKLKVLLAKDFDGTQSQWGSDGVQWEMHHYAPSGRHLHGVRGFVQGIFVLEQIQVLLEKIR